MHAFLNKQIFKPSPRNAYIHFTVPLEEHPDNTKTCKSYCLVEEFFIHGKKNLNSSPDSIT
jgi:hypothetical protein